MAKPTNHNQGELLVVSDRAGEIQPTAFAEPLLANPRIEQKLHLVNALADLAGAKMRDGLVGVGEKGVAERYGERAASVVEGAERIKGELHTSAEENFKKASRFHESVQAVQQGVWPTGKGKHRHPYYYHRLMYSDFLKSFYTGDTFKARSKYIGQLKDQIAELQSWPNFEEEIARQNQLLGIRPHDPDRELVDTEDVPEDKLDDLDTRERLIAFLYDPRAGFLPKFRPELHMSLAWLDYPDNPDNESLAIADQLEEVYIHGRQPTRNAKKPGPFLGEKFGVRAVESNAWMAGDYLLESQKRMSALADLNTFVQEDGNPHMSLFDLCKQADDRSLSLPELFGDNWFGLAALVQYNDLLEYIETGEVKGLNKHPLRTSEFPPEKDRPKFSTKPGKRKTLHNQYTGPNQGDMTDEYAVHILVSLQMMTVGEARHLLPDAQADVTQENAFLRRRMNEFREFDLGLFDDIPEYSRLRLCEPIYEAIRTIRRELSALESATLS